MDYDDGVDPRALILSNTTIDTPHLCPEIRLHLITETCPLWKAGERELANLRLPDPFWGFCWAGGQALARYILDHPAWVRGRRVLDLGAGGGVEAIAAAKSGASWVLAADTDPLAAEAVRLNADLNQVSLDTTTADLVGGDCRGFDVLLAGDMCYDPDFCAGLIPWLRRLARQRVVVLLGDPLRGFMPTTGMEVLASYQTPADVDLRGEHLRPARVVLLKELDPESTGLHRTAV